MVDFQSFICKNKDFGEVYDSLLLISNESEPNELKNNLMKEYEDFEIELIELKKEISPKPNKENTSNKIINQEIKNNNDDTQILETLLQV